MTSWLSAILVKNPHPQHANASYLFNSFPNLSSSVSASNILRCLATVGNSISMVHNFPYTLYVSTSRYRKALDTKHLKY